MSHQLADSQNNQTSSLANPARILCCYVNHTARPQVVRMAHPHLERTVEPGGKIEFTALADNRLEIQTCDIVTAPLADRIPCGDLRVEDSPIRMLLERYAAGERDFRGIDLAGADLSGCHLSEADFSSANFSRAILVRADLASAVLAGARLEDTNLTDAILHRANLSFAKLSGANLTGADIRAANFQGASLEGADFRDVRKWAAQGLN